MKRMPRPKIIRAAAGMRKRLPRIIQRIPRMCRWRSRRDWATAPTGSPIWRPQFAQAVELGWSWVPQRLQNIGVSRRPRWRIREIMRRSSIFGCLLLDSGRREKETCFAEAERCVEETGCPRRYMDFVAVETSGELDENRAEYHSVSGRICVAPPNCIRLSFYCYERVLVGSPRPGYRVE